MAYSPEAGLAFVLLPAPTGADLLAILDRVIRRVARQLANEDGASSDPAAGSRWVPAAVARRGRRARLTRRAYTSERRRPACGGMWVRVMAKSTDISTPMTRGELREEFEQRLAPLATKAELEQRLACHWTVHPSCC